jgi:hypothetical protein
MTNNLNALTLRVPVSRSVVLDIIGLAFIYFIPTFSHFLNVPLYLVEPMRIMLILAIAHTTKRNAFILALTLPLFSFLVSAHPVFYKTLLMTAELVLNVWLFYALAKVFKNYFAAMLTSIVISKLFYYILKFGLISVMLLDGNLFSTPIYLQVITTILFSGYVFLMLSRKETDPNNYVDPTK